MTRDPADDQEMGAVSEGLRQPQKYARLGSVENDRQGGCQVCLPGDLKITGR